MAPGSTELTLTALPTEKEARAAIDGFSAYCGPFEVNRNGGVVVHHVEIALTPDDMGQQYKRMFKFDGDTLILRSKEPSPAVLSRSLIWERVP